MVAAGVGLLDDARDDVADAVLVLLEHDLALGLAHALEDHLLGGLRGDAPEVVGGRDVGRLDLAVGELRPVDHGLGLDRLERHRLALRRRLGLRIGHAGMAFELLGCQHEREDADVARLAVELDARERLGVLRLAIGGQQRILERGEQDLGIDPLLVGDDADGVEDLLGHLQLLNQMSAADRRERNLKRRAVVVAYDCALLVALEQLAADAATAVERSMEAQIDLDGRENARNAPAS